MKLFISLLALSITLSADITLPQNFKTDFHQSITNEKGKVINYEGTVLFKNLKESLANIMGEETNYTRSLFKWSYTVPTKKEVCTDGTQLIVVDHDLEQVSNYLIEEGMNLDEILKIANKISSTDYQATYKDIEYLITLDDKAQLQQIVYVDSLDNNVKIIFKNMNYNTTVNETSLECSAPEVYDIIKG
ncbi:MAG: Outer membrane lipoprotein carrier protein LolA [uncultured Sulfurovum sp.]|uniref:Outer membrane lipoprotein carrier protein LolA n=1 Tax=uncultured Sulfurovum sp. TaxID=269237 RepID=A0A6S6S577_9BACT|nr:MAG: Outer membrane lipoprotein carrier protein LolA [uncultured Sulfurovum sp.]